MGALNFRLVQTSWYLQEPRLYRSTASAQLMFSSPRPRQPEPVAGQVDGRLSRPTSQNVHAYIQQCQVAVGLCARMDYVAQASLVLGCLKGPASQVADLDRIAAAIAIWKVADGFLKPRELLTGQMEGNYSTARRAHVHRLLQSVRENYSCTDLTLGRMARHLKLSAGYLSRALGAETGFAFRTHLNGVRMLSAVLRMHDRTVPIRAVAARVGYPDTKELDRQFWRWFRLRPRDFRSSLALVPFDYLTR